jgi:hypothetical protein
MLPLFGAAFSCDDVDVMADVSRRVNDVLVLKKVTRLV